MNIGDFNIQLETTCSNSKTFHSLIEAFNLIQKVSFPTHIHGHTLNLVLTLSNNDNISYVHTTDAIFLTTFQLVSPQISQYLVPKLMLLLPFVNTTELTKEKLKPDHASELLPNPHKEANTLYSQYHSTLSSLFDKHATSHTKYVKAQHIIQWVNKKVIEKR